MPANYALQLREALVTHWQNDPAVTDLIPALQIYGVRPPANPPRPFSRVQSLETESYEATGYDGSEFPLVRVHVFAEGPDEVNCSTICNAMQSSIAAASVAGDLELIRNEWLRTNIIVDGEEADLWHGIIDFDMAVISRIQP
ncbi:hypothetical protein HMSP1_37 [Sinorhizobium phage HMSP1-Susan]|nr:hypothetical protein HMSP1_37 [Sinorhizobium phage HMSP1-Susan]